MLTAAILGITRQMAPTRRPRGLYIHKSRFDSGPEVGIPKEKCIDITSIQPHRWLRLKRLARQSSPSIVLRTQCSIGDPSLQRAPGGQTVQNPQAREQGLWASKRGRSVSTPPRATGRWGIRSIAPEGQPPQVSRHHSFHARGRPRNNPL